MKVVVAGTRTFNDYNFIKEQLDLIKTHITEVISGGCHGADRMGEKWAKENNIPCTIYRANWALMGKAAGPYRNGQMIEHADMLIAFWDSKSKGTADIIKQAEKKKIIVKIVNI